MKANMLLFAPLCLLLCWMLPAATKQISVIRTIEDNQFFPLDLAENSVDDMYYTCSRKMEEIVENWHFKIETRSGLFKGAWDNAKKCANRQSKDKALTKEQKQAICVYSSSYKDFYMKFNEGVRTGRQDYSSSFPFHSLHFWLTRAIQILRMNQTCHITYRRTRATFTGSVNKVIRFGNFASSSYLSNLTHFGDMTCYKITTCLGAYLKEYPVLRDKEQEVLIPPYEMFQITKKCETKECKSAENLSDCKMVYVLMSAGILSNLDCQIAKSMFT